MGFPREGMMFSRKKIIVLLLLLIPISHATALKLTTEHAEYEPSSTLVISGVILGDNNTDYIGALASINVSGRITYTYVNKTGDDIFFSASVTAPSSEGNHRYTVSVPPPGEAQHGRTLVGHGVLKVRTSATLYLSKDKSEYFVGDSVVITATAKNSSGDPYYNLSLELRLLNSSGDAVYSESTYTNANGTKEFSLGGLSAGDYTAVVNDVYSLQFSVSIFTASLLIADSSGTPSSRFRGGDAASFRVQVLKNNQPLTTSEAPSYAVTGSVETPASSDKGLVFSFRNGTFVYDYNISSGSGKYAVSATVTSNTTVRALYSEFYVNDYEVYVSPVYTSASYSGSFAAGDNITLAVLITNLSSGGKVENASLVVSVYASNNNPVNLSYSVLLPSETGDDYFQTNHLFKINLQNSSTGGRYIVVVNATVANATASGRGEFYVNSIIVTAHTVSVDGRPKSVFSLDDTVRIKAGAYNRDGSVNITSLKLVSLKDSRMRELSVSPSYNVSSGIISFASPRRGGWYTAEILVNGVATGHASFLVHLYEVRARVIKNGTVSVSGWYGWNYFGPNDDLQLEVTVYSTSSSESSNTMVTISNSSKSIGGVTSLGFPDTFAPRVRTIGTLGVSADTLQDAVPQGKGKVESFGVVTTLDNSSTSNTSVAVGYSGESLNEVQGVTVSVEKIVNGRTWEEVDVSRLVNGTTDSTGRAIINIPKPQGGWQSGWYTINVKAKKTVNGEIVSDSGYAWFNVKSFWVWAYPSNGRWYFAPSEVVNITVQVRDVSNYAGITGVNVSIEDVYSYGSEDGYMYSSTRANYTSNSSLTVNGTAILYITPQQNWRTGSYNVRVLARDANNETGYGYTGFSVRVYDVWGYGVDPSNNNYKWTFGRDDNITLQVSVREPLNWHSYAAGVNVTILKIYDTTTWPYRDVTSSVNLTGVKNVTTSTGARLTIPAPLNGSWSVGNYYAVIRAVNGTDAGMRDSGTAWFSVRAFDIVAIPLKNNAYTYVFGTTDSIIYNITVCRAGTVRTAYANNNWVVTACSAANSTIDDVHITTWNSLSGRQEEIPINISGNGTASTESRLMNITRVNSTWDVGWYSVSFKVYDPQNPAVFQSEYVGYSVRLFDVYVQPARDYFSRSDNASFNVTVCQPGGCDYYYNTNTSTWVRKAQYYTDEVNLSATTIYGPGWGQISANRPTVAITNGTGTYNISPSSGSWSEGWYSVSFTAASGYRAQDAWGWFNVKSFTASGYAVKWQYSAADNVTIRITSRDPSGNLLNTTVNNGSIVVRRWSDSTYTYDTISVNANVNYTGEGRADVTLSPAGGVWGQGYHYVEIPVSLGSYTQSVWASFYAKLFEVYARPDYPAGQWYFTPSDSIAINVSVCNQGTYNWYSRSCVNYSNTVIVNVTEIYTYDPSTWRSRTIPYSASFELNGSGRINISPSNLTSGSYNVYLKVSDKNNAGLSERGYAWFELKNFELYVEALPPSGNYFLPSNDLTFRVSACLPGTRTYYWNSTLSRSLVNCSNSYYPANITAVLSSLRRYDPTSWRYVDVAVRNVSVNISAGTGILSVSREDLYNATLSVGQYYADIRAYATPEVYERYSAWFNVKIFEILSYANTPEGWYFLPSEDFTVNVSACMPGTISYRWNSTKYKSEPYCTPYSGNVTAAFTLETMYDSSWAYTRLNVSANLSRFSGSSLISVNRSLLPQSADGNITKGYYYYSLRVSDADSGNISDTAWGSAYFKYFDASVSAYSTPAGSAPVNLTIYAWARNGTRISVNVSGVEVKKYDYTYYQYNQISISNWTQANNSLTVTPSSAWTSGYHYVYANMSRAGNPSAVERASGGFSVS